MGGRLATYEDSREVFLRSGISGFRGRGYATLQELDSSALLPRTVFRTNSELAGQRKHSDDWIQRRLFGNRFGHSSEKDRPLGRRIDLRERTKTCKSVYIKTKIEAKSARTHKLALLEKVNYE